MSDSLHTFAANLKRLRKERKLTQEALAEAAGVHLTHISKIERCVCEPGAKTIAKLARGLGVSAGPLFDGVDGD
jgi:transcriptional regulator with XRE-family HTH domain